MKLTPREVEKLMLHNAGFLAQKRLARGQRLNHPEAVALIATQVEGTFPDGTKLITIHDPIASENGNLELALYGSFLPVPSLDKFPIVEDDQIPGELSCKGGCIMLNCGRKAVILKVTNTGDRPIQVGSHYPFIEVNPYLVFDRRKAYGMRLNIPAGTAIRFEVGPFDLIEIKFAVYLRTFGYVSGEYVVRFYKNEPGDTKSVTLVKIGGRQVIRGGSSIADGPFDHGNIRILMEAVQARGFGHSEETSASEGAIQEGSAFTNSISREAYANMYGPTTGDKVRLGDTDLFAEIERDFAVYGDECIFGGGKVLRDGMGQACGCLPAYCLDTVITNAVIIDYTGIFKADIGIRGGLIVFLGKAGNPDIMDGVSHDKIIGVSSVSFPGNSGGVVINHWADTLGFLFFK
ncbi:unnamed protein product [Ilex paraguariensis]|uniref:urease n=1 Tax=Ilex paraguariensis TaxID=185542 RepID=A0ABC8SIC5_9AQUA